MGELSAGFEDPLGILLACHERIVRYADLLIRLNRHITEKGYDLEAQGTAKQIQHYFSTAGKLHHQDEEQDLFPILIEQSNYAAKLIDELEAEHDNLDKLWLNIEPVLLDINNISHINNFNEICAQFYSLNKKHITMENEYIFPIAQQQLTTSELQRFGTRMAQRRGIIA